MRICRIIVLILPVLTLFACASMQTRSPETIAPFSAQGWGGANCADLLHDTNPAIGGEKAGLNTGLYQSWISGFVSGVNYSNQKVLDISGDTGPNVSFDWIKSYCLRNPDSTIPEAMHRLILQWYTEGKSVPNTK